MNDDQAFMFESEPGPSWERPNWPVEELDELNLGLDPTQATIEKVRKAVAERAAAAGASPDEVRRAADDSDPRDDADPHLSRARPPRGASSTRSACRGWTCRRTSPQHTTASPRPTSTARSSCSGRWLRAGDGARDRARAAGDLLRPHRLRIHAHLRRRGAALHPGADRARRRDGPFHARGQAVDPGQGHPRRAVGKIPRPQICRDQALRPRRRRKRGSRARSGDQICAA